MTRCTPSTCLLALGLLALALPCGAVPAEPDLSGDPGGGIAALDGDIIIDYRIVHSTVALGSATVNRLFPDLHTARCSNYLSDVLAQDIAANVQATLTFPDDPRLAGFSDTWGTLTNMEFLLGPLDDLGDPVLAVQGEFQGYLDAINAAIGGGATMTVSPSQYLGFRNYGLYGGILETTPGGDIIVVMGEGPTEFYEVNAVITVPADAFIIPEPATLGLLAVGGIGLLVRRRRRGHASGRPLR